MERLDVLIRDVRDQTGNQQYSSTQGIRQREFVRHANDAQTRIYNRILQERSTLFTKVGYIDVTANDAIYDLPADVFLKHNVLKVDYSNNGDARNYSPLAMRTARQEVSVAGFPDSYFLRQGEIVLSPIPSQSATNGLRLNYQYTIPTLDVRRGQIDSVSSGGGYIASVTLDAASIIAESSADLAAGWIDYVSVVDADGDIISQTTGCQVLSYVVATGVLTFVLSSVPSATNVFAADQYVVFGKYASTHSQLPEVCERYLRDYLALRIQMRDSNTEAGDTLRVLSDLEEEILKSVANLEEDLPSIPISDFSMLNYDEDL